MFLLGVMLGCGCMYVTNIIMCELNAAKCACTKDLLTANVSRMGWSMILHLAVMFIATLTLDMGPN